MNKKQLNKIKSIYQEGCNEEICIKVIASICAASGKSHIEMGVAIHEFLKWVSAEARAEAEAVKTKTTGYETPNLELKGGLR